MRAGRTRWAGQAASCCLLGSLSLVWLLQGATPHCFRVQAALPQDATPHVCPLVCNETAAASSADSAPQPRPCALPRLQRLSGAGSRRRQSAVQHGRSSPFARPAAPNAVQALAAAVAADGGKALAAVDPAAAKLLEGAAELAYNAGLAGEDVCCIRRPLEAAGGVGQGDARSLRLCSAMPINPQGPPSVPELLLPNGHPRTSAACTILAPLPPHQDPPAPECWCSTEL